MPVTFNRFGFGTAVLASVNTSATWINAKEGHTLNRTLALNFGGSCSASPAFTGPSLRLTAGDWHNLTTAPQDGVVDVVDFSILASEWGLPIDPNASDGADTTGDGEQGSADFTVLTLHFLETDEAVDSCPAGAKELISFYGETTIQLRPRAKISVQALPVEVGDMADLNRDGVVDAQDIREFPWQHNLPLLPEFERKLEKSRKRDRGLRGFRR